MKTSASIQGEIPEPTVFRENEGSEANAQIQCYSGKSKLFALCLFYSLESMVSVFLNKTRLCFLSFGFAYIKPDFKGFISWIDSQTLAF